MTKWQVSLKAVVAECFAMTLFVFIGTGTAVTFGGVKDRKGYWNHAQQAALADVMPDAGNTKTEMDFLITNLLTTPSWGIITALAFGLAITVMAYATGHLSGGQLNPAVTFGLVLVGEVNPLQAIGNVCAQVLGAILGSSFLYGMIPNASNSNLGSNSITPGVSVGGAFLGEAVMTCVLVSVVLETAVSRKSIPIRAQAPLAIGFAVFTAHAVLLPIDGCSINPARSLGPAIVSDTWPGSFWVFVVGPLVGAIFSAAFHLFFRADWDTAKSADPISLEVDPDSPRDAPAGKGSPTV